MKRLIIVFWPRGSLLWTFCSPNGISWSWIKMLKLQEGARNIRPDIHENRRVAGEVVLFCTKLFLWLFVSSNCLQKLTAEVMCVRGQERSLPPWLVVLPKLCTTYKAGCGCWKNKSYVVPALTELTWSYCVLWLAKADTVWHFNTF